MATLCINGSVGNMNAHEAALLAWQVRALDIHNPGLCLRLFRANREVGLAVGLALLIGRI